MTEFIDLMQVYAGSNGEATKALYHRLAPLGPAGHVAMNLFRAHKASSRAKVYRGRGYRGAAYDRKQWSIDNATAILGEHAVKLGIRWGWKVDPKQAYHRWVIYVDLPTGQVSFHTSERGIGPDYLGEWDGCRDQGPTRICQYVQQVLAVEAMA